MSRLKIFTRGIISDNPVFVLLLGMCPTLGVTSSATNGLGMGISTLFVLVLSNIVVSLVKNFIPDKVRIPAFIVIIASFVTVLQMVMQAYFQALYNQLGLFIPLIVVNCLILGRAEGFASKNNLLDSVIDGLGMGTGFTLALTLLGAVREALGEGALFGWKFIPQQSSGILLFVLAPGAFILLGYLIFAFNQLRKSS